MKISPTTKNLNVLMYLNMGSTISTSMGRRDLTHHLNTHGWTKNRMESLIIVVFLNTGQFIMLLMCSIRTIMSI